MERIRMAEIRRDGAWHKAAYDDIREGDVFRVFESDGSPANNAGVWLATSGVADDHAGTIRCVPFPYEEVDKARGMRTLRFGDVFVHADESVWEEHPEDVARIWEQLAVAQAATCCVMGWCCVKGARSTLTQGDC